MENDNYQLIRIERIAGALGAVVRGADLAALDDATFQEIRQAFNKYLCLFFEEQHLSVAQFENFGRRFGPLSITSYVSPVDKSEYVHRNVTEASHKFGERNFGDNWHADQTVREKPNSIAALYSVEAPAHGGDTMFSSLYAAYETLSPRLRDICNKLTLMHSASGLYGPDGKGGTGNKKPMNRSAFNLTDEKLAKHIAKETPHPLVVKHPETGRLLLYIAGPYAVRFEGMTEDESQPLIQWLYRHAQRPEFTMRWRWKANQVALWDNRCCLHFAIQDYEGMRREMLRLEVEGETPLGVV